MFQSNNRFSWAGFIAIAIFILLVSSLYLSNIIRWADEPDNGFFYRSGSRIDIIGGVYDHGLWLGLQAGDKVLKINEKPFTTIRERRDAINYKIGEKNSYIIERDGDRFEVVVVNTPLGLKNSFIQSGLPYFVGMCYVLTGVLVFLMKPHYHASWVYYIFGTCLGLLLTFLFKGGALQPSWLGTVHIFLYSFSPAAIIHLSLSFPKKRNLTERHPISQFLPYIASAFLFIGIRSIVAEMLAVPKKWYLILITYFVLSLILFIISCFQLWIKTESEIVRARSKIILLGTLIATSVPIMDTSLYAFSTVHIVPGFNYYLPFLIFFPSCIGYAIIKHNLFDIDAAIRRTFGYILVTIGIALVYTLFLFIPGMILGKEKYSGSPGLIIGASLLVIFVINLFRDRMRRFIDKVFYRSEYDYEETVVRISTVMRSPMTIHQIVNRMMELAKHVLFIEKGHILLLDHKGVMYESVFDDNGKKLWLSANEPFIQIVSKRTREITRYDIEEDPSFTDHTAACRQIFDQLEASLIIPLIYEEKLTGLMVLGEKKSGKFYRRQDILLLNTLANQGAVAIENARLQESYVSALEVSKKELELLNKAKGKALDLLSHELKTPLSIISLNLELLKREGDKNSATRKDGKVFERLDSHLKRLLDIQGATEKIIQSYQEVEETVSPKRLGESSPDVQTPFDLFLMTEQVLESVKRQAGHRELVFDLNGAPGLYIRINPKVIEDVFIALLKNAIENTPDEGLIRISLEGNNQKCILKIHDFGAGITAENQKYLFEGLFHTQETDLYSSKKPYDFNAGGKGLDLFRVKVYSQRFGFDILMDSKRCTYLPNKYDVCSGRISACPHCRTREDCLNSGGSMFGITLERCLPIH